MKWLYQNGESCICVKGYWYCLFLWFSRLYITLGIHYKKINKLTTYKKKTNTICFAHLGLLFGNGYGHNTQNQKKIPTFILCQGSLCEKLKRISQLELKDSIAQNHCLQTDNNNNIHHIIQLGSLWSYGSWIYNYLYNQCLSPLKLWVRTPFMARCTQYNFMW